MLCYRNNRSLLPVRQELRGTQSRTRIQRWWHVASLFGLLGLVLLVVGANLGRNSWAVKETKCVCTHKSRILSLQFAKKQINLNLRGTLSVADEQQRRGACCLMRNNLRNKFQHAYDEMRHVIRQNLSDGLRKQTRIAKFRQRHAQPAKVVRCHDMPLQTDVREMHNGDEGHMDLINPYMSAHQFPNLLSSSGSERAQHSQLANKQWNALWNESELDAANAVADKILVFLRGSVVLPWG